MRSPSLVCCAAPQHLLQLFKTQIQSTHTNMRLCAHPHLYAAQPISTRSHPCQTFLFTQCTNLITRLCADTLTCMLRGSSAPAPSPVGNFDKHSVCIRAQGCALTPSPVCCAAPQHPLQLHEQAFLITEGNKEVGQLIRAQLSSCAQT